MKRKIISLLLVLTIIISGCSTKNKKKENNDNNETNKIKYSSKIEAVTSLEDSIKENSVWCGTFNLVWNILKDKYVKDDVKMNPQPEEVNNLNKSTFNEKYLNENSYYTNYGKQTTKLKKEIETAIKEKFNQTSDILDSFTWDDNSKNDFMYSMLYKKFTFNEKFAQLENGTFNNEENKSYRYFGIDDDNRKGINQVTVLYYKNDDEYAVKINTKENDQIILVKGNNKNNFLDTYNAVIKEEKNYNGNKKMNNKDTLAVPYLKFNTYKSFDNLKNKPFKYADGSERIISEAVQTIQLELNESGGDIKSEAAISTKVTAVLPNPNEEIRNFNYTSNFTMFLIEKDKDLPYFAAYITSLDEFQKTDSK